MIQVALIFPWYELFTFVIILLEFDLLILVIYSYDIPKLYQNEGVSRKYMYII